MSANSEVVRAGRPSSGTSERTVDLRGRRVHVRPAVAPLIELLVANAGKVLTLEWLGEKLDLKPMTVRYYMVDARIALASSGYRVSTIQGEGVMLSDEAEQ